MKGRIIRSQRYHFKSPEVNQHSECSQRFNLNNNDKVNQSTERSQRFYFNSS